MIKLNCSFSAKNRINLLFTFILTLTIGNTSFAQNLFSEPAGGIDETELIEAVLAPIDSYSPIPDIFIYKPLTNYYSSWDTLYVRRYAENYPETPSELSIPLFNQFSKDFAIPFAGEFLSPYGYRGKRLHAGVDIKLNKGDSIKCAFDGVVRVAKYNGGYGNCVVVRHFNGLETLYAHMSKMLVTTNQAVKAGEILGLGGSTGRSTCNHLHFETRFQGQPFNPRQIFDFVNMTLVSDTFMITNKTYGKTKDFLPEHIDLEENNQTLIAQIGGSKFANTATSSSKKASVYHKVKKGDTLGAIAKRHRTTVSNICKLNNIKSKTTLKVGRNLKVK